MGRAGRLAAIGAAAAAWPAGCALDTSGLVRSAAPQPDASPADVSSPAIDAAGHADVPAPPDDGAPPPDVPPAPDDQASVDAPPAPSCATGVLFCDGFEQGLGAWPTAEQTNGAIGLDGTHVHRGYFAVHAHLDAIQTGGGNPHATVDHPASWPDHYWVRSFVYAPSPFPPANAAFLNLVESNVGSGLQLYFRPSVADVALTTFNTSNDQDWASATMAPLDQWDCLELDVDVHNNKVNASLNGNVLPDLSKNGVTLPFADTTKLGLGFFNPSPQGAYDVWLDDVIVDDKAIGCTK